MKKNMWKILFTLLLFLGIGFNVSADTNSFNGCWTKDSGISQSFDLDDKVIIFSGKGTINITKDFEAFIVVEKNSDITINLNNHTISSIDGVWDDIFNKYPSISQVHNFGKLTINGEGVFVNKTITPGKDGTYGQAVLANLPGATMILNGGTYTRSVTANGDENSGYIIRNMGDLVIDGNVNLNTGTGGDKSSLIASGWNLDDAANNYKYTEVPTTPMKLVINNGNFVGGKRSVNTEGHTVTTINGGIFKNDLREIVKSASTTIINGGTFTSPVGKSTVVTEGKGNIEIFGGEFSNDVSNFIDIDSVSTKNNDGSYSVEFIYADYSKIGEMFNLINSKGEGYYTEESLKAFDNIVNKINWDLGKSKQKEVDAIVAELKVAFANLKKVENPKTNSNSVVYILSIFIVLFSVGCCFVYRKKLFN